jgi:nitrogen fixation NifU-like protein
MMTEQVRGKSLQEVKALIEEFKGMMQGRPAEEGRLGDLVALQGVRRFPVRVKCATLAWMALLQGVQEYESGRRTTVTASTEDEL